MVTIATAADVARGLEALAVADPRLAGIAVVAGDVRPRRHPGGFAGLARIVVGQQVSVASADAIWRRLTLAFPDLDWPAIDRADAADLAAAGLSGPKIKALAAVAAACRDGLDLEALGALADDQVRERLTAISGVGPWTADIYLLVCLGRADVFPASDLALRRAVQNGLAQKALAQNELAQKALAQNEPLGQQEVARLALAWSPWRSVAALLFWAYYSAMRSRSGVPV